MDWQQRRVTVMGLGRHGGGVAVVRYLAEAGAKVTVTDLADEAQLSESLEQIEGLPIARLRLGEHLDEDFARAEVVIVNPAVRPGHPLVKLAQAAGAWITSEMELFWRTCPAKIVAVTGANGKSTTTAMLAASFEASGRRTWLGGNIGRSLLPELTRMTSEDWVALEVSSFQLAQLGSNELCLSELRRLEAAIVTNCRPNHLDWHETYEAYQQAKQRLPALVRPEGIVVINPLAAELADWPVPEDVERADFIADEVIPPLKIPGEHHRHNARCAASAALAVGFPLEKIQAALADFRGLPHRLEFVGEVKGRTFINDSMATTPESVVAALEAIDSPVWLLAGGKDKGGELTELSAAILQRAAGVCFYGDARGRLLQALLEQVNASRKNASRSILKLSPEQIGCHETLAEAVAWCFSQSSPGDVILLSPACASYDQYRDYADRARHFVQLMQSLS